MTTKVTTVLLTAMLFLASVLLTLGSPRGAAANVGDSNVHRRGAEGAERGKETPKVVSDYGNLPLSFEANQGQTDKAVRFLSRGSGYGLYLTPTEMVLTLKKAATEKAPTAISDQPSVKSKMGDADHRFSPSPAGEGRGEGLMGEGPMGEVEQSTTVRMKLIGANPSPKMAGEAALPGRVNYLIGKDPKKWRTNIPTFGKVRYEAVYPGIDLVYYGNQGQMEYDFVVAPGADPNKIGFDVVGAHGRAPLQTPPLQIADNGDLVLSTDGGEVRMKKPIIYQEIDGTRVPVDGGYRLAHPTAIVGAQHAAPETPAPTPRVSFQVAAYDRSRSLVIDPVLVYSTYLGGSGEDFGNGIAVDSMGNAYITGYVGSTDFPTTNPTQGAFSGGFLDVFVTKINAAGTAHTYSTYLGGSGRDGGCGIAVDSEGNAYITGETNSTNFPTTNPVQGANAGGYSDVFVTKINAAGAAHTYSTYLGGSDDDYGYGIAVDSGGNAYITGDTRSTNFPTTNPIQGANAGDVNGFVTKINASGAALTYSTYLGGNGKGGGKAIAVDSGGNAYITGETGSTNFPTTNPIQGANAGNIDVFVTKINADCTAHIYSTYLGGSGSDYGKAIAVDGGGNAYITGRTGSTNFPTTNPIQGVFAGDSDVFFLDDVFVTKINAAGAALTYSTYLGGSGDDVGYDIAVDSAGNAYITGDTRSTNFPTTNSIQGANAGSVEGFVTKIGEPPGQELLFALLDGLNPFPDCMVSPGFGFCEGAIEVVDLATMSTLRAFSIGSGVWTSLAVSPDGQRLYVVDRANHVVAEFDWTTGALLGTVPVLAPNDVVLSADGSTLYVSGFGQLVAIDTATSTTRALPTGSDSLLGLALSPDGTILGAASTDGGSNPALYLVDAATLTLLARVPITHSGEPAGCATFPNDVTFTDTGLALLWDSNCDNFYQVDVASRTQLTGLTIRMGRDDGSSFNFNNMLSYSRVRARAYALKESQELAVVDPDMASGVLLGGFDGVPLVPVLTPNGRTLFVAVNHRFLGGGADTLDRYDTATDAFARGVYTFSTADLSVRDMAFTTPTPATNQPPVISNPGNQTSAEGDAAALQLVATDPDGDVLTYSAVGLPAGLTLNAATGLITGTPSFDSAGVYVVSVTASDGTLTDSESFIWAITNTNRPPVIVNSGNQTNAEGDSVFLQLIAADPDGDVLTAYAIDTLLPGLTLNPVTGLITGTLSCESSGVYAVTFKVTDGIDTAYSAFTWTVVEACGTPPPPPPPPPTSITCGGKPVTILGTPGDDVIRGTDGPDVIHGLGGNDWIHGGKGNDVICGGNGDDHLIGGAGHDFLLGGRGRDRLFGDEESASNRSNKFSNSTTEVGNDLLMGGQGNDVCQGGGGQDRYRGCERRKRH